MAASVHGALVDGGKAFGRRTVCRFIAFGAVVTVHVKTHGQERTVTAEVHIGPKARETACHLGNELRIGSLRNGAFLMLFKDIRCRNAHHRSNLNGGFTHGDFVSEALHLDDGLGCSAKFRPAGFGVFMQVAATRSQTRNKFFNFRKHCFVHNRKNPFVRVQEIAGGAQGRKGRCVGANRSKSFYVV